MEYNSILYLKRLIADSAKANCTVSFQRFDEKINCVFMTNAHNRIYLGGQRKYHVSFSDFLGLNQAISCFNLELSRFNFIYFGELYYSNVDSKGVLEKHLVTVKSSEKLEKLLQLLNDEILSDFKNVEAFLKKHSENYLQISGNEFDLRCSFLSRTDDSWSGFYSLKETFWKLFPSIKEQLLHGKILSIQYNWQSVPEVFEASLAGEFVVGSSLFEVLIAIDESLKHKMDYRVQYKRQLGMYNNK